MQTSTKTSIRYRAGLSRGQGIFSEGSATARFGVRDFEIQWISGGFLDFSLDFWISVWICGFRDFRLDFWISNWISGFQNGFLDFTVDFWISKWISELQSAFLNDFLNRTRKIQL